MTFHRSKHRVTPVGPAEHVRSRGAQLSNRPDNARNLAGSGTTDYDQSDHSGEDVVRSKCTFGVGKNVALMACES
jgi:hypothetical protein